MKLKKVLYLERKSPRQQYKLEANMLQSSLAEKDLDVFVDTKLNTGQQWALVAKKVIVSCVVLGVLPAG